MIPVLRTKSGTQFAKIAPGGFRMLAALDDATLLIQHDLVITAGTNDHTRGRHPLGEAYDVSVAGLFPLQILRLIEYLHERLGPRFTILFEVHTLDGLDPALKPIAFVNDDASGPHLHLQVKKDTTYPPPPDSPPAPPRRAGVLEA